MFAQYQGLNQFNKTQEKRKKISKFADIPESSPLMTPF
jgi:hypothetical protein